LDQRPTSWRSPSFQQMFTVIPPRAFNPFTQPFAHLSRGRAGSRYRSFMVLWTSISATAAEKLQQKIYRIVNHAWIIFLLPRQLLVKLISTSSACISRVSLKKNFNHKLPITAMMIFNARSRNQILLQGENQSYIVRLKPSLPFFSTVSIYYSAHNFDSDIHVRPQNSSQWDCLVKIWDMIQKFMYMCDGAALNDRKREGEVNF